MKKSVKVILCLFGMNNNAPFTCRTFTVHSHRRRRERQSGRKSFIFNVSRRRAPARAARRVLGGESVEES